MYLRGQNSAYNNYAYNNIVVLWEREKQPPQSTLSLSGGRVVAPHSKPSGVGYNKRNVSLAGAVEAIPFPRDM